MTNPVGKKVLIQPQEDYDVAHQGTIIRVSKKIPDIGLVVRVSPDIEAPQVKEGDLVKYLPNHRIEEEDGILIDEDNILLKYN